MVKYLKIDNPLGSYKDFNVLGEIKGNYEALYSLDLYGGEFSTKNSD